MDNQESRTKFAQRVEVLGNQPHHINTEIYYDTKQLRFEASLLQNE